MPSLGLGLGLHRRSLVGGLDSDVKAFASESGATDLTGLNDLVVYLKEQSLYSNFVIYPMKSAQNAGNGATLYGIGGLTSNNATLVASPTWGAGGLSLNGSTQYGYSSDFLGGNLDLTVFSRGNFVRDLFNIVTYWAQYDIGTGTLSAALVQNGAATNDCYQINRSDDGSTSDSGQTQAAPDTGADNCIIATWPASSTAATIHVNKVNKPLSWPVGTKSSKFDSSENITIGAALNSGSPVRFAAGTYIANAVCEGVTLTTTQRETITDYINAL